MIFLPPTIPPHSIYMEIQGGIGGMYSKHYATDSSPYGLVHIRDGMAYRLAAGYLREAKRLGYGLELGYAGYPQNDYSFSFPDLAAAGTQKYTGKYVDLLGVLRSRPNAKGFYLLGKAGVAYVYQTFNGSASALGSTFNLNRTLRECHPEVILGIGYELSKKISFDLSYQAVFAGQADPNSSISENSLTRVSTVKTLMAGILYYF